MTHKNQINASSKETVVPPGGLEEHRKHLMRDLVELLRKAVPLLENVRTSIEESTVHIPGASKQLSSASRATESATVEILNTLETIAVSVGSAQEEIQKARKSVFQTDELVSRLLQELGPAGGKPSDAAWTTAASIRERLSNHGRTEPFGIAEQLIAKTKEAAMSIAITLQVQDITSQQIAGATKIIESVRLRLSDALDRFEHGIDSPTETESPEEENVFDTSAEYDRTSKRQKAADEIVRRWHRPAGS